MVIKCFLHLDCNDQPAQTIYLPYGVFVDSSYQGYFNGNVNAMITYIKEFFERVSFFGTINHESENKGLVKLFLTTTILREHVTTAISFFMAHTLVMHYWMHCSRKP